MRLKWIGQKHTFGSGPAALAMLTLQRYDDVAGHFPLNFNMTGLGVHEMDAYLSDRGYAVARRRGQRNRFREQRTMYDWPAEPFADRHLCEVNSDSNSYHFVVMDRNGNCLDPRTEKVRTLSDYREVVSIAGVFRTHPPGERQQPARCEVAGEILGVVVKPLDIKRDPRGWLAELFRIDECEGHQPPVMGYVSATEPGVRRGPHEHRHQTDYFCFMGPGNFRVTLWDARPGSVTRGCKMELTVGASNPTLVIVPAGVVHGYVNVSRTTALSYNFPNRLYRGPNRSEPVDEIRHEDNPLSTYVLTA